MIFELGKEYIVDVTEKGIIPLMVFDKDRWFDKDYDDLDFLTDEEKTIVVNEILNKIRAEIKGWQVDIHDNESDADKHDFVFERIFEIIDKYRKESGAQDADSN